MVPVLALCITAFGFAAGCHVLAAFEALQELSIPLLCGLYGSVLIAFVAAILTHPKSQYQGGHARLGFVHCLKPMQPAVRAAYLVGLAYSILSATITAPRQSGSDGVPVTELLDEPYFLTAFILSFAICALAASHSAVLFYKRPFGFDGP